MSKDAEAQRSIETHREGQAETFGAFLSPFKFFRVDRLLWCSSLPRGWLLAFSGRVDAEALSPCLQLSFALQHDVSEPSRAG